MQVRLIGSLKKIGTHQSPSPFEKFIAGEINPFDDIGKHNPKGAGQFESINDKNDSNRN